MEAGSACAFWAAAEGDPLTAAHMLESAGEFREAAHYLAEHDVLVRVGMAAERPEAEVIRERLAREASR